jgi:hypothetical protein
METAHTLSMYALSQFNRLCYQRETGFIHFLRLNIHDEWWSNFTTISNLRSLEHTK